MSSQRRRTGGPRGVSPPFRPRAGHAYGPQPRPCSGRRPALCCLHVSQQRLPEPFRRQECDLCSRATATTVRSIAAWSPQVRFRTAPVRKRPFDATGPPSFAQRRVGDGPGLPNYAPASTAAALIARARFLSRTHGPQDSHPARLREGIPARVGARTDSRTSTWTAFEQGAPAYDSETM